MIVICPTDCQLKEPPAALGALGALRSIRTVACFQPDVNPAPSTARKRTSVSPSLVTASDAPATAGDQLAPPSVEVERSYPAIPEPGLSAEPDAETVTEAVFRHALDPPLTDGSVGGVVSRRAVSCAHTEALPAPSTALKWTSVWPCAETSAWAPVAGADQLPRFHEKTARQGSLGTLASKDLIAVLLANAGRLDKYGA